MNKIFFLLHFAFIHFTAYAAILYVDVDATGSNSGVSWANAYTDLHPALGAAVPGDEIWVAQGIFFPTNTGDRSARFELPSGVRLIGGFSGSETTLSERGDPMLHPTIISGDIGVWGDSLDNSYNLLYCFQPDSTTLVDGFEFRDALANKTGIPSIDVGGSGGGIYLQAIDGFAYITIKNCRFIHNTARNNGAGIFLGGFANASVSPLIENCHFIDNRCLQNGAAIYWKGGSQFDRPRDIERCDFIRNRANQGGAIYWWDGPGVDTLDIGNCNFKNNSATFEGSSLLIAEPRIPQSYLHFYGNYLTEHTDKRIISTYPGLSKGAMAVNFKNNEFSNNYLTGDPGFPILLELLDSLAVEIDSLFFNNNNISLSGGFSLYSGVPKKFNFSNLFFCDNLINLYIFSTYDQSKVTLKNIVLVNNKSNGCAVLAERIDNMLAYNNNDLAFYCPSINNSTLIKNRNRYSLRNDTAHYYNCIFDDNYYFSTSMNDTIFSELPPNPYAYQVFHHCIFKDSVLLKTPLIFNFKVEYQNSLFFTNPLFVSPGTGDFHLQPCSPAVHFGVDSVVSAQNIGTDLDGNPRIQGGRIDLGPFESSPVQAATETGIYPSCGGTANGRIDFVPEGGCPPFSFDWSTPTGSGDQADSLVAGSYTVTVTDSKGSSNTIVFEIPDGILSDVTSGTTPVFCGTETGGSMTVSVEGGLPPYLFDWGMGAVADSVQSNLPYGIYTVTISDQSGCTGTISAQVGRMGSLQIAIDEQPIVCYGDQNGSIAIQPLNGAPPYRWLWSNGDTVTVLNNLSPGTYTGTMTDALGCGINWIVPLLSPDTILSAVEVQPASGPSVADGRIEVNLTGGAGGFTVAWSNGLSGTSLVGLLPGSYTGTATDQNGCSVEIAVELPYTSALKTPEPATFRIWPIPAHSWFIIDFGSVIPVGLWIYDGDGRQVKNITSVLSSSIRVDTCDLPAGTYHWVAELPGGKVGGTLPVMR